MMMMVVVLLLDGHHGDGCSSSSAQEAPPTLINEGKKHHLQAWELEIIIRSSSPLPQMTIYFAFCDQNLWSLIMDLFPLHNLSVFA